MSEPPELSAAGLRALVERSGDAVVAVDGEGRVCSCNAASEALFGCAGTQLVERRIDELAVDAQALDAALARVRGSGVATSVQLQLRRAPDSSFAAELTLVPAQGGAGLWLLIRDLEALRRAGTTERELQALTDAAFEAVLMHAGGIIRKANRAAELYAGVGPGELVGRRLIDFIAPQSLEMTLAKIASGDDRPYEAWARRADGTIYPVEAQPRSIPVEIDGGLLRVVALRDMSERKALEEQLRQAQKLEAIGRLAVGVAHDFNNLLAVIMNAGELVGAALPTGHPCHSDVEEIVKTVERGATLVRQLLAFGRKSPLAPCIVEVAAVVGDMRSMFERMIGTNIELALQLCDEPTPVFADPASLEQVLLNLVINARDAIGEQPGRIVIELERVELADNRRGLAAGSYVELRVRDDGVGMDEHTQARIFEPFFTTKQPDRGTGLGLATVFGIVEQSGGAVSVSSEVGEGSCFCVVLPVVE